VLLDECVDSRLAASLGMFDVRTVAEQAWVGISNGQLLGLAAAEFDVFVTADRNFAVSAASAEICHCRNSAAS